MKKKSKYNCELYIYIYILQKGECFAKYHILKHYSSKVNNN